jgi:ligand-binding SRPBCC domain-containing protein
MQIVLSSPCSFLSSSLSLFPFFSFIWAHNSVDFQKRGNKTDIIDPVAPQAKLNILAWRLELAFVFSLVYFFFIESWFCDLQGEAAF